MKITRERLEQILREELAAVTERIDTEFEATDDRDMDLDPGEAMHAIELGYIDLSDPVARNASGAALYKKHKAAGKFDMDEGAFSDMSAGAGRFDPKYAGSKQAEKDDDEAAARKAKRGPGAFDNMSPEEPDDAFKGLSIRDITVD